VPESCLGEVIWTIKAWREPSWFLRTLQQDQCNLRFLRTLQQESNNTNPIELGLLPIGTFFVFFPVYIRSNMATSQKMDRGVVTDACSTHLASATMMDGTCILLQLFLPSWGVLFLWLVAIGSPFFLLVSRLLLPLLSVRQTRKGWFQEILGCEAKTEFKFFNSDKTQIAHSLEDTDCFCRMCCA